MVDAILLISGGSSRMGQEKALLPFSGKTNFVCHLIESYLQLPLSKVYCVINPKNSPAIKPACLKYEHNVVFIKNSFPEKGRIWSVLTGLKHVKKGNGVFIQNIDNPFTDTGLLKTMLKNYKSDTFLVPRYEGKNGHPLLLGDKLVQELKGNSESITDLKSFLNGKIKQTVTTQKESVLANINSPEEYRKWFPDFKSLKSI